MVKLVSNHFPSISLLLTVLLSTSAMSQGLLPVPSIDGATVSTDVVTIPAGQYEYRYTINIPASATGTVWLFEVDVSAEERTPRTGSERRYPTRDGNARTSMRADADLLAPFFGEKGQEVVITNQIAPIGWNGGLTRQGFVQFAAGDTAFAVQPGVSASGFNLQVARPPTIRRVDLTPDWVLLVDDHDLVTDQEVADGAAVTASLAVSSFALGPLDIAMGGRPHYNRLGVDISAAESIGWANSPGLVVDLRDQLGRAYGHVRDGNNGLAQMELQSMLDSMAAADPATYAPEFRLLVDLNVEALITLLPDFRNTFIPVFEATPERANLLRGDTFTWTLRHFNSALEGEPPLEGLRILIRCVEDSPCANIDALTPSPTFRIDATGQVDFSYIGANAGFDLVEVVENDFEVFRRLAVVGINWTADADLVVPAFVPPFIGAVSGDTIFLTDLTANRGTIDVTVPTITRYYISSTEPVDVLSATILGERIVPPLAVDGDDESLEVPFVIPPGFDGEPNYLAACADAEDIVVEADESNNCSFSETAIEFDTAALIPDPDANVAPTASDQSVETDEGVAVAITLEGQDVDGDTLTYSVLDGPTSGALSGATPDLTYEPNIDFDGLDSFTFVANDGTVDSNVATVTITVNPAPELDCSTASASPNALWPPNHKLVTISVSGVFSLDGSNAQIVVTGIEQDEPVNGVADGNTSPDGFGVGTDSPQVRRERSGQGDGRIYFIAFDASESSGTATCSGTVTVGVPHDQGQGSTPIDSGVRYDSSVP